MAGRIAIIMLIVLCSKASIAGAVDYVAAGAVAGDAASPAIVGYRSVSSGLVTVYAPIIAGTSAGSPCAQPGVAYRPVMPPATFAQAYPPSAACSRQGFDYRLMVSPLGFPGFGAPTPNGYSMETEFPAGVK